MRFCGQPVLRHALRLRHDLLCAPSLQRGALDVDQRNRIAVSPAAGGAACGGRATRGFFDSGGLHRASATVPRYARPYRQPPAACASRRPRGATRRQRVFPARKKNRRPFGLLFALSFGRNRRLLYSECGGAAGHFTRIFVSDIARMDSTEGNCIIGGCCPILI
ncbi:MAG: hypothetical protein Pg6A_16340 [Termitinemataceae bacterium]|nr:MAG: hypothetical protein Pg6A_16340 [Termitinemataceae bacterium]